MSQHPMEQVNALALKVNVSNPDQEQIYKILEDCGYPFKKKKFHCTFGFIDKIIPKEEVMSFGDRVINLLQEHIDSLKPTYEVEKASHLFGHIIAFEPTVQSAIQLHEINQWLFDRVSELSEGRFTLNKETQPNHFTPHMTLWRTHKLDERFNELKIKAQTHSRLRLTQAGFVIF